LHPSRRLDGLASGDIRERWQGVSRLRLFVGVLVRNGQYGPPAMRLLVARCEVLYTGRLTARLPEAVRLLIFKADVFMTTQAVSDL
jgi:hypothetical protein